MGKGCWESLAPTEGTGPCPSEWPFGWRRTSAAVPEVRPIRGAVESLGVRLASEGPTGSGLSPKGLPVGIQGISVIGSSI